jgi:hypothetical protein
MTQAAVGRGEPQSVAAQKWRQLLVRGSLVLMETIWVYALVAFAVAITVGGGKPSFIGTLLIVGGSFTISRLLQGTDVSLGVLRTWGAVMSILAFYAVVRVDFFEDARLWDFSWADQLVNHMEASLKAGDSAPIGVPLLVVFWIRGVLKGQQSIAFEDVLGSFATGVVVVAAVEVFGSMNNDLPRGVELIAVPYIAVGLAAIGLTHAGRAENAVESELMPAWLLAIGGVVLVLTVFSLLFVLIDFSTAQDGLEFIAFGIGWVIAGIFFIFAWPVIKILEGIFWFMQWLAHLGNPSPPEIPPQDPGAQGPPPDQPEPGHTILPNWVDALVRIGVAGGLVFALVLGTAMLFTRFQRRKPAGELKESVYSEGRLAADLSDFLGSMLGRLRPRGGAPRQSEPVRRLYFEMLAAGEARGVARRPVETPLEISPRLQTTFASATPAEITGLFDDVRYGAHDASADDVRRLREEWQRMRGGT